MILKLTCLNSACEFAGTLYDFNASLIRRRESGPLFCPVCSGYLYSVLDEDYVLVDVPRDIDGDETLSVLPENLL